MILNLLLIRDTFLKERTFGQLFIDGVFFCHILEDTVRSFGVKIKHETAIPSGLYDVKVTYSGRFKRQMPIIFNQSNGYEIIEGGIGFKGVRFHGGNTEKHTSGCPLVAYKRIGNKQIYKTAEKDLTARLEKEIENGKKIRLTIKNS